jgi:hypothetical protein
MRMARFYYELTRDRNAPQHYQPVGMDPKMFHEMAVANLENRGCRVSLAPSIECPIAATDAIAYLARHFGNGDNERGRLAMRSVLVRGRKVWREAGLPDFKLPNPGKLQ